MMRLLRRWMIAGLVVWLPLAATILIVRLLVDLLDQTTVLFGGWSPPVPGLGIFISLVVVLMTGALVANFMGRRALGLGESLLNRIPLVRSIYSGVKKLTEVLFSDQGGAFRDVCMLEYPRAGLWTLGFVTGPAPQPVIDASDPDMLSVYVPTAPNPTSGYVVLMPRTDITVLAMSVEDALQLIISMGAVSEADAQQARVSELTASTPPRAAR